MNPIKQYIAENCEQRNPERPSRKSFDFKKLFALAELNDLDVKRFKDQIDHPFSRGRVRMNVGNLLQGKFRRDGFIHGFDGEIVE